MTYAFNLNWDELNKDLKEQKIQEYMDCHNTEIMKGCTAEEREQMKEDLMTKEEAKRDIKAHFPIYF